MVAFELDGIITADGKLEVELPDDIAPGNVRVVIEPVASPSTLTEAEDIAELMSRPPTWTDEELAELLKPEKPMTGKEIVEWLNAQGPTGWEDIEISGAEWLDQQREKRRKRYEW